MIASILNLCDRIETDPSHHRLLIASCNTFQEWDDLLFQAELQGMGPLLYRHLISSGAKVPDSFLRGLRFLCLRHRRANELLMSTLRDVLSLFAVEGIQSLVLKGAALCQTLYPESGLRPMRDIDLLLTKEDAQKAHALLQKNGFLLSSEVLPNHYYHLPPLLLSSGGMQVCVELHHGLFPKDPPYYREMGFTDLFEGAVSFVVDGVTAYTLADEDMLYHLFQHGFHAPLTYEPYKSISVADIVSLVEARGDTLDWEKIRVEYPGLYRALALFHHLTPWSEEVLKRIPECGQGTPSRVGEPFVGWPRVKILQRKNQSVMSVFQATLFPGNWWLILYYGISGSLVSILWCRIFRHPIHLLRWVKIYGMKSLKKEEQGRKK